jgi:hypothetical protein
MDNCPWTTIFHGQIYSLETDDHLIENLKNMSVDEGYESDEDLLDADDIGKASDLPLP